MGGIAYPTGTGALQLGVKIPEREAGHNLHTCIRQTRGTARRDSGSSMSAVNNGDKVRARITYIHAHTHARIHTHIWTQTCTKACTHAYIHT